MNPTLTISEREHKKGRVYILLTALLWGLAGVCVKSITWSSMSIMGARSLVSMIILGIYQKSFRMKFTWKNILGALLVASTGILYMIGIKNTDAATAIVLQYTAPIFVLLFSIFFKHIKPSGREIIIVVAVFFGCVLSFADKMGEGHMLGNIVSLISGVTYAAQIILFSEGDVDAKDSMMISNVLSLIICIPFMFFDSAIPETTPEVLMWLIFMSVFQYSISNILYAEGCKRVNDIECSLLLTLEPIFNPIPVAIICGEHMGPLALVGFAFVIGGIVAYTTTGKSRS